MERNRLLITSMRRGSILVAGTILAGFAWAFKKFIEPDLRLFKVRSRNC